jgi:hypothetical protein
MPPDSKSRLVERLLETLSLAEHYEEQNPPNEITRAALQASLQDLIAELRVITAEPEPDAPGETSGPA